ncbi:MAG: exo-alpha-sialidase [Verrucomicrobia bacterium]|nr:exo-alpha-sialidase [Verrucomicrobiota bacterium]
MKMKIWKNRANPLAVFLMMTALVSGSVRSQNTQDDLPALVRDGDEGYVSGGFIFELDGRPTPECHASTIEETPFGIVAAWFAGTEERHQDVAIRFARHDGKSWLPSVELADGSEGESKEYPCWNPVLFQPRLGPLMLFYKVGPSPSTWWGMLMTSQDGGQTWSKPRKLGTNPALGAPNTNLLGPVKNKPVQLSNGSILCPSSSEHNQWRIHFELTHDSGKSWEVIGPIHDGRDFNAIQPTILTHANGTLQALCRSKEKVLVQTWSRDNGQTWSSISATHLPNPNAGPDAVTLRDGRHLLVYNHSVRENGRNGRHILNVALSEDGIQWTPEWTLEKHSNPEGYSYPAVIQSHDGLVHITYTWRRVTIKHVVLDPSKF